MRGRSQRRSTAAALLAVCGCLGPRAVQQAEPPSDGFALVVPFEDAGGLVIVEVAVAGVATPQRFVVDTGAGTSVISARLDRALGSSRRGNVSITDASSVTKRTPITRLAALELGGVRFTEVGAAVLELDAVEQNLCTRIDGILGTNVLHHGVLELDYPGARVRLASSPERLPTRTAGQPLALVGAWMPYLAIDDGGRTFGSLLLDSGSTGALSLPSSLREPLGVTDATSGHGTIGVGAHGPVYGSKHAFAWPTATIGGRSFVGVETVAHDTDTGTLGARVLRAYVVRIDYRLRTAALWPSGAALPHAAHSFGFEWTAGEAPQVSFVWAGSAAAKAGIAPGQPITAIDGRRLASMTAQARCELARDMSALATPSSRSFQIEGRHGPRTIVLERVPL